MVLLFLHMLVPAVLSLANMFKKLRKGDRSEAMRCSMHLTAAAQVKVELVISKCKVALAGNLILTVAFRLSLHQYFRDTEIYIHANCVLNYEF